MEFLAHRTRTMPQRSAWDRIDITKNTYFKNCSNDFLRYMRDRYNIDTFYTPKGTCVWYTYANPNKFSIMMTSDSDAVDTYDMECYLIDNYSVIKSKLKHPEFYDMLVKISSAHSNLMKHNERERVAKDNYLEVIDQREAYANNHKNEKLKFKKYLALGLTSSVYYFEFNDVVAEDTDVEGDDINIGDVKFQVNLNSAEVKMVMIEGSQPRYTRYNAAALHPHDLGSNICLGSQSSDMIEAVRNLDLDVIQAMLHKFAHSYTSGDSAGEYWRAWTEEGMRGMVYSEYHDRDIPEDEAIELSDGTWIFREDAVTLADGSVICEEDAIWCEHNSTWERDGDTIWCERIGSEVLTGDTVEMSNEEYMPIDHPDVVEYEDQYFYEEDMVIDIEGNSVPKTMTYYSEALGENILIEQAIEFDGDFYTADTLPSVYEETYVDTTVLADEEQPVVAADTE